MTQFVIPGGCFFHQLRLFTSSSVRQSAVSTFQRTQSPLPHLFSSSSSCFQQTSSCSSVASTLPSFRIPIIQFPFRFHFLFSFHLPGLLHSFRHCLPLPPLAFPLSSLLPPPPLASLFFPLLSPPIVLLRKPFAWRLTGPRGTHYPGRLFIISLSHALSCLWLLVPGGRRARRRVTGPPDVLVDDDGRSPDGWIRPVDGGDAFGDG